MMLLLAIITPWLLLAYVWGSTAPYRYDAPADTPSRDVAIVFGAGLRRTGEPTRILADRINAAIALYELGRVPKLLMTGDNSSSNYDEVTAMHDYAVQRGVPEQDITLDYAGFRTYDSCYRGREIFGVERAVLVTQSYHLARAVYICRALGMDAVGLGAQDWGVFSDVLMTRYTIRESLAILYSLLEVHITRPLPTFLGPYEGLK
jgi:vancomycin permeability regulator SanA